MVVQNRPEYSVEFPAIPQNRCKMEYCLEKLKKNIDDYLDEKSSKEELGNWGKKPITICSKEDIQR